LSQQVSKQKTDSAGRLAVVGDRELVIGYRLIGIDDTFIVSDEEDASKKIQELYSSGEFGLIIASNSMRTKLSSKFLAEIEESIEPLVLFMPSQKEASEEDEESIAALAKRVLGISIEVN
jgi:V/A-type H+-transporting ATPase subunit F